MNRFTVSFFLLLLTLLNPLVAVEDFDERKRNAFKDVVEFVLDFSHASRGFDEEALKAVQKKPKGYEHYGSKVFYMLKALTELENKRPQLLNIVDQEAHWIFDPKEFLRKK